MTNGSVPFLLLPRRTCGQPSLHGAGSHSKSYLRQTLWRVGGWSDGASLAFRPATVCGFRQTITGRYVPWKDFGRFHFLPLITWLFHGWRFSNKVGGFVIISFPFSSPFFLEHDCSIRCSRMGRNFDKRQRFGHEDVVAEPEESADRRGDSRTSVDAGEWRATEGCSNGKSVIYFFLVFFSFGTTIHLHRTAINCSDNIWMTQWRSCDVSIRGVSLRVPC